MSQQISSINPLRPAEKVRAVTPDDDADLPDGVTRGLLVGAAGNVVIHDAGGHQVTIPSGDSQYHPIRVRRVRATGTTATGIVALY